MEQLNLVQLRGIVGSIKVSDISGRKVARISLATNYAYKTNDGCPVIETSWHSITAFEGKDICDLCTIERGTQIDVLGRLRVQRYTRTDGSEASMTEVLAHKITIIPGDSSLTIQQE